MDVQFQITSPNNCSHTHVAMTTPDGVKNYVFTREELLSDLPNYEIEVALKGILAYLAKTNNLNTLVKIRNFLEGKTFKI